MPKKDENKKKVSWILDKKSNRMIVDDKSSNKAELEKMFQFELTIYKDPATHVESLRITNFKQENGSWQENGSIVTSILDLNRDIRNFKRFGVVMGDTYYRDLVRRIEEEYVNIPVKTLTSLRVDARYTNLLSEIIEFFDDCKESDKNGHCYMPVTMFNELASDCGFNEYEMKGLREQLTFDQCVFIKQPGRFTMLKRLAGKTERVVVFDKNNLMIKAPNRDDTEHSGDSDE